MIKVFYRYKRFLVIFAIEMVLFMVLLALCHVMALQMGSELRRGSQLSGAIGLTDLSIWDAARYARNPVLADRFNPFQDFPASIEHFPEGSIIYVPEHLRR